MTFLAIVLLGYGAVVTMLYFVQDTLVFPGAGRPSPPIDSPLQPERLRLTTEDGAVLEGLLFGPKEGVELLIGFGGNAQDAEYLGHDLADDFPDLSVVVFHYRGYGPSSGRASQEALLSDAVAIHDAMVERLHPTRVLAIGISLGSSVAAYLSKARRIDGLILVTPFDSVEAIARSRYFWIPVGWLLRHPFPTIDFMTDNPTPVAVIAAEHDQVVSSARTRALVESLDNVVFHRTLEGADHTSLYQLPIYDATLEAAVAAVRQNEPVAAD
jgi:alpha-beta hydrolase superfamily lysophospholipase